MRRELDFCELSKIECALKYTMCVGEEATLTDDEIELMNASIHGMYEFSKIYGRLTDAARKRWADKEKERGV